MINPLGFSLRRCVRAGRKAASVLPEAVLAATAEQLAATGQWQRLTRLRPALEQGLLIPGLTRQAIRQTVQAIGNLAGHHLDCEEYSQAHDVVHFLHNLSSRAPQQVDDFISEEVAPVLEANQDLLTLSKIDLKV